jgi:hypothetical protein
MLDILDQNCFPVDLCGILIHIPSTTLFSIPDAWIAAWSASLPVNGVLIVDPPGFDLQLHNWVLLNRFRHFYQGFFWISVLY